MAADYVEDKRRGDRRSSTSLEVTGGPIPFKIKGILTFLCVIIAVLLYGYSKLVDFTLDKWGPPVNIGARLDAHEAKISAEHTQTREAVDALTYVTALPAKEREALASRMKMPDSLRRQLKNGD